MNNSQRVLVVHTPETEVERLQELRDFIIESMASGVLVLPLDTEFEELELPSLGAIEVVPTEEPAQPEPDSSPEPPSEAEEKRAILQQLKDYREVKGREGLEAVSAKTAYQRRWRVSTDTLWDLCADVAPKLPIGDWRKIGRALELLKQEEASDG